MPCCKAPVLQIFYPAVVNRMWFLTQDIADQYLRDRRSTPVLQAVIGGKFAQQIICKGLPYRSEKEEEFYQVLQLLGTQALALVNYG